MACIVITCTGTLGDHLPYIALGCELKRRRHTVRIACNPAMLVHVQQAGLAALACGPPLDDTLARAAVHDFDDWQTDVQPLAQQLQQFKTTCQQRLPWVWSDLLAACRGADLLVCGVQQSTVGALVAQRLGMAWVDASVIPALHAPMAHLHLGKKSRWLPYLPKLIEDCLQATGLLPNQAPPQPIGRLLAASARFCQPSGEADRFPTGFWFYDPVPDVSDVHAGGAATSAYSTDWRTFVLRHPAPLVLSFSSQPLVDAQAVLAVHAGAAHRLGKGLVVQRGWADFQPAMLAPELSAAVCFTGFIAQDELFAQASAVLHHGGIGTVARALRQGCPMVVEPHGNDQFYNAQRVVALGVGAAVHPHKISVEGLARTLAEQVLTEHCRHQASAWRDHLQAEDGTACAADLIDIWLTDQPRAFTPLHSH